MAKRQFKDLAELQKYLLSGSAVNQVFRDKKLKDELAKIMSKAVKDVVYSAYTPSEYRRRRDQGGLSDVNNMDFTSVTVVGGQIRIKFENLTMGQTNQIVYNLPQDTAVNSFLTDIIVDDNSSVWARQGEWSESRDFITETVNRIRANPTPLINAIKSSYRALGFTVR